jgi:hypothetical protein
MTRRRELPAAAELAVARGIGAADSAYWARRAATGLFADNPAQTLAVRFGRGGITVRHGRDWVGLRSTGPASSPLASHNRVSYRRPGVEEWYANGPLGLEQGFTISSPGTPVAIALSGTLRPRLTADAVDFVAAGGRAVLRYGGLQATDATGRPLPARLKLNGRTLRIAVDDHGARYPIRIDPLLEVAELTAGGTTLGQVGWSLAMSGDTIAAGADTYPDNSKTGTVYVFVKPPGGWADTTTPTARLDDTAAVIRDHLGQSVAISGNTIIAGGHGDGYAAIWVMPAGGWVTTDSATATLTNSTIGGNTGFGTSVAIDGDTAVVGDAAGGQAYVYTKPGGGWADATLPNATLSPNPLDTPGFPGWSVAVQGATVVVGDPAYHVNTVQEGAVLVFTEPPGGWGGTNQTVNETAILTGSDITYNAALGTTVAFDAGTIVAGAPYWQNNGNTVGAAYVFEQPAGGWVTAWQNAVLSQSDFVTGDQFGSSVAISGSTIAVGDPEAYLLNARGAVYLFDEPGGGWTNATESQKLTPPADNTTNLDMGHAVAVEPGVLATSADTSYDGRLYVFGSAGPTISTKSPLPSGNVGVAYDTTMQATGGTAPLQWAATGLPAGLQINQSTGEITGTPTATASATPTITVIDADLLHDSHQFNLTIGPRPANVTLTIKIQGDGTGFVEPGSTFTCYHLNAHSAATTCKTSWPYGSVVNVHATPTGKSAFPGWLVPGICISITADCSVTMTGDKTVTASFFLPQVLTINRVGTGGGYLTATALPDGAPQTCITPTCSFEYPLDTSVMVHATPLGGAVFAGYSGACSGTADCGVTMFAGKTVNASFSFDAGLRLNAIEITQGIQTSELPTRSPSSVLGFHVSYKGVSVPSEIGPVKVNLAEHHATVVRVYASTTVPLGAAPVPPIVLKAYRNGKLLAPGPIGQTSLPGFLQVGPLGGDAFMRNTLRYQPTGAYTFTLPDSWTTGDIQLVADGNTPPSTFPNCFASCQAAGIELDGVHFNPVTPEFIYPIAFSFKNIVGHRFYPAGYPNVDPAWYETAAVSAFPIYIEPYRMVWDATGDIKPADPTTFNYKKSSNNMLAIVEAWADANDTNSAHIPFGVVPIGGQYGGGLTQTNGGTYSDSQPRAMASENRPITALAHELHHAVTYPHAGVECGSGIDADTDGGPAVATGAITKGSNTLTSLSFSSGQLSDLVVGEGVSADGLSGLITAISGPTITVQYAATKTSASTTITFTPDDLGQTGEDWPPSTTDANNTPIDGLLDGVGLDTNSPPPYRIIQSTAAAPAFDLMSYCGGEATSWISVKNWNRDVNYPASGPVASRRQAGSTQAAFRATPPATVSATRSLNVTAVVDLLSTTATVERIADDAGTPTPANGQTYLLVGRDVHGTVITTAGTVTSLSHVEHAEPVYAVSGRIAAAGVREIDVMYNGAKIGQATASAHAPTVTITSPTKGSRVGGAGGAVLRWSAHDADGGSLTVEVRYSADGGHTWHTIYGGPNIGGVTLPSGFLSASKTALVRVYVSDGFNQAIATSPQFRALGAPPLVTITSPRTGTRQLAAAALTLTGVAWDDGNHMLAGKSLTWTAGRTVLGRGASISPTTLTAGRHTITLTATDHSRRKGRASIVVTILPSPPTLTLLKAPRTISRKAKSVTIKLASLAPATVTVGHTRATIGRKARSVKIKIKRGKTTLTLILVLKSGSYTIHVPVTIARR